MVDRTLTKSVRRQRDLELVFDVLGDEYTRTILTEISEEALSVKELTRRCDLSHPTIYRRLNMLHDNGLVTVDTRVSEDGNHYKVYSLDFNVTVIFLHEGGFEAYMDYDEDADVLDDI